MRLRNEAGREGLKKVHRVRRAKGQLKSFVESRLVAVRTDRLETALGNFRSVGPKLVIRKCVRLGVNLTVAEYSVAVLAV